MHDRVLVSVCSNAIRVRIQKQKNESITRSNVLNSLLEFGTESGNNEFIQYVDSLAMVGNNNWLISFIDKFDYKNLIGKSIKINDREFVLEDAELPVTNFKIFTFKFIGLQPNFDKIYIHNYLINQGIKTKEIVEIYDEYYSEPMFKHIKKGTIRAKLKFDSNTNNKYKEIVDRLPKNTYINGLPVSIQRVGQPRCLKCNSLDHKIAQCPKKNLKCNKCNGAGHLEDECNLAKRIAQPSNDHNFDEDEIDDSCDEEAFGSSSAHQASKKFQKSSVPDFTDFFKFPKPVTIPDHSQASTPKFVPDSWELRSISNLNVSTNSANSDNLKNLNSKPRKPKNAKTAQKQENLKQAVQSESKCSKTQPQKQNRKRSNEARLSLDNSTSTRKTQKKMNQDQSFFTESEAEAEANKLLSNNQLSHK